MGMPLHRRQRADNGRPIDTGERFQDKACGGHQRPGVAGAHAGVRIAALDQVDGDAHGRILLAPQGERGQIVHLHPLGGVAHGDAGVVFGAVTGKLAIDGVLIPDQNQVQALIL